MPTDRSRAGARVREAGESVLDRIRESTVTGIAIIVPLRIACYLLIVGVNLRRNVSGIDVTDAAAGASTESRGEEGEPRP